MKWNEYKYTQRADWFLNDIRWVEFNKIHSSALINDGVLMSWYLRIDRLADEKKLFVVYLYFCLSWIYWTLQTLLRFASNIYARIVYIFHYHESRWKHIENGCERERWFAARFKVEQTQGFRAAVKIATHHRSLLALTDVRTFLVKDFTVRWTFLAPKSRWRFQTLNKQVMNSRVRANFTEKSSNN